MATYIEMMKQVLKTEAHALELMSDRLTSEQADKLVSLYETLATSGGNLIVSGVGKSGIIAQKIAATFSSLGLPSFFLHPTEAMHGDLGRVTKSDALVLLSKSGTTEELLALLPYVSVPSERIVALVGNPKSPIALKSGIVFDCGVEKEACINDLAPTTSTTTALAMGDAMAVLYETVMGVTKAKFAVNHPAGLLGKSLLLTVNTILVPHAQCAKVNSTATLQDTILAMTQLPVGMCAVVDGDKLLGILVEGDIRRAFAKSADALKAPITEIMNKTPISVDPSSLAFDALKLMETGTRLVTVVPVVDGGKFIGVLRLHDLLRAGFVSSKT